MLDGIVIVDKEKGYTSFDVVAKLRKILQTKKIGHTGTLDPLATGVLVVCIGKATKLVQYLTSDEKIYEVKMKFGIKTDTGDITGMPIWTDSLALEKCQRGRTHWHFKTIYWQAKTNSTNVFCNKKRWKKAL